MYIIGFRRVFIVSLATLVAVLAQAQTDARLLQGEVKDQAGALIVGAKVELVGAEGSARAAISDAAGRFRFGELRAGEYQLKVSAQGFAVHEEPVDLRDTATARIAVTLYPTIKESLTIDGDETERSLDPERAAGAQRLADRELQALPDDPDQLAEQLQRLATSSGGAPGQAVVTVDGFQAGGRLPPKSAIREVRINPNIFSAEYDTPPFRGGRIEVTTKPAADGFHGAGFFNYNGAALNARDPFAPQRAQNQTRRYGLQFGAPIVKKRAGFFLDLEQRDIDEAATVNAVILDEALRPATLAANVAAPKRLLIGSSRVDWQLNQSHTLAVRYDYNRNRLDNQGAGGFNLPERGFATRQTEQNLRFTETAVINEKIVNDLRVGITFNRLTQRADSDLPIISVAGAFTAGGATPNFLHRDERRLELADNLIVSAGRHQLKLGAQILHKHFGDARAENPQGSFFFGGGLAPQLDANGAVVGGAAQINISSLDQYRRALLSLPGGAPTRFTLTRGQPSVSVNQWLLAGFAQDEWRLRRNLTASFGFRFEAQTAPMDKASLAPRLGLAYTPDKKQNWVLRARAGIFYDRISEALTLEALRLDGLRQEQIIIDSPSFPDPFAGGDAVNTVPMTRLLEPSLRPPSSLQARVELERQLPRGWRISLSHNWTRGWGELRSRNINAPLVDAANPDPFIAPRPFGVARNVLQFESSGSVKGRVLFVGVNQAANKRFNIFSGYLYFDFLTDADNAFLSPQSSYDLRGEWAPPVWQTRHRMFLTATINLPWQSRASFSLNAASGAPYNITSGRDNNGDGDFNDRPSVVATTQSQAILTPFGALDPGVVNGNLRRNAGINPANATLDINLSRSFDLGRPDAAGERPFKLAANVRASNLLNRANLLGVNGVLASPFFGRANASGPARRIEIGLRFSF
jgi:Carboxypeptidase regulatory-like domain/TonB dependent receptor